MKTLSHCLLICLLLAACSPKAPEETTSEEMPAATAPDTGEPGVAVSGIDNRGSGAATNTGKWWAALPRPDWSNYQQISTYHPWFEVYEIMDDIFAIYEPGQFEEVISYLIVGRRQALLFDTGLGMGDIRGVVRELTKKDLLVLNSHSHYDHIGGNHQFKVILGRNLPYTRQRASGLPREQLAEYASKAWIWKPHPPNFDANNYQIKPYQFSKWIDEGQFIDLGGVSLEIVYAPGHAPDSIMLVDQNRRLMFTGDTFYPAPLYAHLEGSSFDEYADTAAKLAARATDVDYLLTAHNVPLANSDFLLYLDAAFKAISADTTPYQASGEGREYSFDGFSILTLDPPWGEDAVLLNPL